MSRCDSATADELLREIATDLMRVPVNERTRRLHLKALALKQEIKGWSFVAPTAEIVDAMHEALRTLRIEVLDARSNSEVRLRSTHRPANDDIPPAFLRRAKG
jgi:hypothetical protein